MAVETAALDAVDGWECQHGTRVGRVGLGKNRRMWGALFCWQGICQPLWLVGLPAQQLIAAMRRHAACQADAYARAYAIAQRRDEEMRERVGRLVGLLETVLDGGTIEGAADTVRGWLGKPLPYQPETPAHTAERHARLARTLREMRGS